MLHPITSFEESHRAYIWELLSEGNFYILQLKLQFPSSSSFEFCRTFNLSTNRTKLHFISYFSLLNLTNFSTLIDFLERHLNFIWWKFALDTFAYRTPNTEPTERPLRSTRARGYQLTTVADGIWTATSNWADRTATDYTPPLIWDNHSSIIAPLLLLLLLFHLIFVSHSVFNSGNGQSSCSPTRDVVAATEPRQPLCVL